MHELHVHSLPASARASHVPVRERHRCVSLTHRLRSSCVVVFALACSGESNSVIDDDPAASSGAGGTSSSTGGSSTDGNGQAGAGATAPGAGGTMPAAAGGTDGVGVAGVSGIGAMGGGDSGGGVGAGPGEGCPARASFVLGAHITVGVSWPATLGTAAGSGEFNLWNLYRVSVDGDTVTTSISPCGSELPPLTFSALVGGGQSLIEIPTSVWDIPDFPRFAGTGSIAGFEPGSAFSTTPAVSLVGLTMAEPSAEWPDSFADVTTTDPDADGSPGITAIPASGDGFTSPPVSIIGPRVDQVNIVSRTATQLDGTFSSCTELSGAATLALFDNHVVGCRTVDGDACNDAQTDFVDSNRTVYEVEEGGTFSARILDEAATCADVRTLP
jgi:hypothetical protein